MADSLLSREMARAAAALTDAISQGEPDDSSTFVWKGNRYPCIGVWNETVYVNAGGFTPLDDCTIQVLKSEFGNLGLIVDPDAEMPKLKDFVTFQGKKFIIDAIQHTAGNYIKYTCSDPAKGA